MDGPEYTGQDGPNLEIGLEPEEVAWFHLTPVQLAQMTQGAQQAHEQMREEQQVREAAEGVMQKFQQRRHLRSGEESMTHEEAEAMKQPDVTDITRAMMIEGMTQRQIEDVNRRVNRMFETAREHIYPTPVEVKEQPMPSIAPLADVHLVQLMPIDSPESLPRRVMFRFVTQGHRWAQLFAAPLVPLYVMVEDASGPLVNNNLNVYICTEQGVMIEGTPIVQIKVPAGDMFPFPFHYALRLLNARLVA